MSDAQIVVMICGGIFALILFIMLITGFSSLSTNQYGINYSGISETIENKTYDAGLYFLGIGHSFVKFPKSVITADFSNDSGADYPPISSRTSDGLQVDIEVSFQYTLSPQHLYDLYYIFNKDYKQIFDKMAIDILTTNTTQYSAYNFFWNRLQIANNMQQQLNFYFEKWCFSQIQFFQLRTVQLPESFEKSIQDTEVIKQSIQQAYANKNKTEISFQTQILKANYQKNVTINLAEGDAQQIMLQAQAVANSTKTVQHQNALAYGKLKKRLGLDGNSLIKYIKNKVIRMQQGQLTVSLSGEEDMCSSPQSTKK